MSAGTQDGGIRLRLPATSANLGPGFDAVGLAMTADLVVEARMAEGTSSVIDAAGRDAATVGGIEGNLILETYAAVMAKGGAKTRPLALRIENGIPLGMGMGSSAAALLAGVAMANHFGGLRMDGKAIVDWASRMEGHPDNVAACWWGGFTVSVLQGERVEAESFGQGLGWPLLVALPGAGLATKTARALLPESYSRADAVFNLSRSALLTAAFARGRGDLLRVAMGDRLHQPYRLQACPLLERLLPLNEDPRFLGVALSGAGPSVLAILGSESEVEDAARAMRVAAGESIEVLRLGIGSGAQCEPL